MSDLNMPERLDVVDEAPENGTQPELRVSAARGTPSALGQTDPEGDVAAARTDSLIAEAVFIEPVAMPGHPSFRSRDTLDRAEQEIKDEVIRMGSLVAGQIEAAIEALTSHDADAATAVIVGDGRINEAQRHVSSLIHTTIATQTPVARDLRMLLSLDHVTYELERIGDHAGSVAKQARKLAPEAPLKEYIDLPRMGRLAADQVRAVLWALVDLDVARARDVAEVDDEIDRLYHAIFAEVLDLMRQSPENVERGTRILFAAHYVERIGDRVTNIAEDIVFLGTGDIEDLNP